MIFYFTGTGNSLYIAKRIAAVTGGPIVSMNDKIKQKDTHATRVEDKLIFVFPTYGWRIPRVVERWIQAVRFIGADKAWFVMNCGSEIGNAAKYNRRLCRKKGFTYMGTAQIVMPENYIAMFDAPEDAEAKRIIEKADFSIDAAAHTAAEGRAFPAPGDSLRDHILSGVANPVFYRFFVKADAFYADNRCIGCGKCVQLCPLNNIKLTDGKPVWGKNCTHCMACICHCPAAAIEYGKKSAGKPRYHLD